MIGFSFGAAITMGALLAEKITGSAAFSGAGTTFVTLGTASMAIPLSRGEIDYAEEQAKAQAMEASVNSAIAKRNTCRAPNLSAMKPLTGMKMASDKR